MMNYCYSEVEPSNRANAVQSLAVTNPSYLYSEVLPRSQRIQSPNAPGAASADHPDTQVRISFPLRPRTVAWKLISFAYQYCQYHYAVYPRPGFSLAFSGVARL